jgi:hypothetical protein
MGYKLKISSVTFVVFVDLQITLTQSLKITLYRFFLLVNCTVLSVVCDYVTWNENSNGIENNFYCCTVHFDNT